MAMVAACARPALNPPADAAAPPLIQGASDGSIAGPAPVPVDAGPGPFPAAKLSAITDAGETDLAVPDASVPALASLRFETSVPLQDLRVRVLTSDARLADNQATVDVDDGGTRVVLRPLHAWPSHACCRFRVDGETAKLPSDGSATYLPFEATFSVEPDPNARPAPAKASHRHHRRPRR